MKKSIIVSFLLFCFSLSAQVQISTNSPLALDVLEEFADGAEFYQIDYQDKLNEVKSVLLVDANKDFISSFENGVLRLNSDLEKYPELLRINIFQSLGVIYGLDKLKVSRSYMSTVWHKKDLQNELFAQRHRLHPRAKMDYYKALKEANPLKYITI